MHVFFEPHIYIYIYIYTHAKRSYANLCTNGYRPFVWFVYNIPYMHLHPESNPPRTDAHSNPQASALSKNVHFPKNNTSSLWFTRLVEMSRVPETQLLLALDPQNDQHKFKKNKFTFGTYYFLKIRNVNCFASSDPHQWEKIMRHQSALGAELSGIGGKGIMEH